MEADESRDASRAGKSNLLAAKLKKIKNNV